MCILSLRIPSERQEYKETTIARNDAEEDILELLNEIKNEEHKSLQRLREELLWQHPLSNQLIGTGLISNAMPIKRQNSRHMLWNKMGKMRAGSDSINSLLKNDKGKRSTW
ncbi:uncharacterized protein LOC117117056 [Anneissia japonica]|uniref:uncharacterized protein LOC117117056 n=1 Tax=Anneissia japonica TaxID=1529436 RepID=UPI001425AAAF|nr:uncharacterized protein LOC117117056 [Anneissia japonica]